MMYKLCFYVPTDHLDRVKQAVFATGAGKIGDYDQCCWQVEGTGQFRPLAGADPFIGEQGQLEQVVEYRVELLCNADCLRPALEAMKQAHPYEEPAFDIIALVDPDALP